MRLFYWLLGVLLLTGSSLAQEGRVEWVRHGSVNRATHLAWAPDGKRFLSLDERELRLWDAATGGLVAAYDTRNSTGLSDAEFTPDGQLIVLPAHRDSLLLLDAATLKVKKAIGGIQVWTIAISPDGKMLATTPDSIRLWTLPDLRPIRTLEHVGNVLTRLSFSPDGKHLARGGDLRDQQVGVFDVATGKSLPSIPASYVSYNTRLAYSPDGRYMVLSSSDRNINATRLEGNRRAWNIWTHVKQGTENAMSISPDSRTVAFAAGCSHGNLLGNCYGPDTIRIVTLDSGKLKRMIPVPVLVSDLRFSPDGSTLAVARWDNGIMLIDAASGQVRRTLPDGHWQQLSLVARSLDGTLMATGGRDSIISVLEATTGKLRLAINTSAGYVAAIAFSSDNRRLLALHSIHRGHGAGRELRSYAIGEWDLETGQMMNESPIEMNRISHAARFSCDGRLLAGGNRQREIAVWDVASGEIVFTGKKGKRDAASIDFSPDGRYLAAGGEDSVVSVWDLKSSRLVGSHRRHRGKVESVKFGRDGLSILSTAQDSMLAIWSFHRDSVVLRHQPDVIASIEQSCDGSVLATLGRYGRIRLYSYPQLRQIDSTHFPLSFASWIYWGYWESLSLSPDLAQVVAIGKTGTIVAYRSGIESRDPKPGCNCIDRSVVPAAPGDPNISEREGVTGRSIASEVTQSESGDISISHSPDPAVDKVTFRIVTGRRAALTLQVYTLLGRRVATLLDGEVGAGEHDVEWDVSALASGVYLYRLEGVGVEGEFVVVR